MTDTDASGRRLTAKGEATRARILDVAAELFYDRGIGQTTNDEIRAAAHVSGSQLNHYFPTRAALAEAVLARRLTDAVDPDRFPDAGLPHSFETLRAWADTYVARYQQLTGGCRVGSLAGETLKSQLDLRDQLDAGFERWRQALRDGLDAMKDNGELAGTADTDYLSFVLLSALQGGLLLTQVADSTAALEAALNGAIEVIESYASKPASSGRRRRR